MDETKRVLTLLPTLGREAVSYQTLSPGMRYWFDGDACVAFTPVPGAWICCGSPLAPPERQREVLQRFVHYAHRQGKRLHFFGVEEKHTGLHSMTIGLQAEWTPSQWTASLQRKRSLREQLRRARAKGVHAEEISWANLSHNSFLRTNIESMLGAWQKHKAMPPMHFMVHLHPWEHAQTKRYFVAQQWPTHHKPRVVAFLVATFLPARQTWFVEHVLRSPEAPNGSVELLFSCAMRQAHEEQASTLTMGLAPLSGPSSPLLQHIAQKTRRLYDFEGLYAFKAKLQPQRWRPIYLASSTPGTFLPIYDTLRAFAGGSYVSFGLRTLQQTTQRMIR